MFALFVLISTLPVFFGGFANIFFANGTNRKILRYIKYKKIFLEVRE